MALLAIEKLLEKARQDQILNMEDDNSTEAAELEQIEIIHRTLQTAFDGPQVRAVELAGKIKWSYQNDGTELSIREQGLRPLRTGYVNMLSKRRRTAAYSLVGTR